MHTIVLFGGLQFGLDPSSEGDDPSDEGVVDDPSELLELSEDSLLVMDGA